MRVVLPGPVPPVAARPWGPPPVSAANEMGPSYGVQSLATWAEGESDTKQVIDTLRAGALWRISVFGEVLVNVHYGTQANRHILELQAPVVMTLPGQVSIEVRPVAVPGEGESVSCEVTLTQATAGARPHARKLADASGGVVALDDGAVSFTALTASTLTISGISAVAVPALSTVPLVAGSTLDTGSGFQEFDA